MSDLMLLGALRQPLPDDPAQLHAITWAQIRDRMRQAADRIEALPAGDPAHEYSARWLTERGNAARDMLGKVAAALEPAGDQATDAAILKYVVENGVVIKSLYVDDELWYFVEFMTMSGHRGPRAKDKYSAIIAAMKE